MDNRRQIFISHSSKNQELSEKICDLIEKNDVSCWIAPRNILGGQFYAEAIVDGIEECTVFLLVLSNDACLSPAVIREIECAFSSKKIIIPFCVEDCSITKVISFYLSPSQFIKGYPDPEKNIDLLWKSIEPHVVKNSELVIPEESFIVLADYYKVSPQEIKKVLDRRFNIIDNTDLVEQEANGNPVPLSNEIGPKGSYSILQNPKGELMLMMDAREGKPESPQFLYDGSDTALLYRHVDSSVAFRKISEEARKPLLEAREILVVESYNNNDVVRYEYIAPILIVENVNDLII